MRVLVATDGSEMAGVACRQAVALASQTDGPLRIVSVVPPADLLFGGLAEPAVAMLADQPVARAIEQQLQRLLDLELARTPPGLSASSALLRGRPAAAILTEAARWSADLVVVGSRGHGTLAAVLLGSVSQELVDRSDIPVLVARRPEVRRVLLAVDPAGSAAEGASFLVRHHLLGVTDVKVAGVIVPTYPWWVGVAALDGAGAPELEAAHAASATATHATVDSTVSALQAIGVAVTGECLEGEVADELERSIAAWDADVTVVGSRRRHALQALVLGSVARKVLQHAPSSVLVVHPTRPAVPRTPRPAAEPVAPDPKEHPMKILLAYDGDPSAKRALQTAAKMAQAFEATIDVVSVVPYRPGRAPMDPWDDRDVHDLELQDAVKQLAMLGLTCKTIEPIGAIAPEIERVAREGGYDLVVVGSRGLGTLDRLLQGSVSGHVATHAETTVVVAR
jgi:nucleotide-binding universal stress UspA family protein